MRMYVQTAKNKTKLRRKENLKVLKRMQTVCKVAARVCVRARIDVKTIALNPFTVSPKFV